MRAAVGALVVLTLLAGFAGPWLEEVLHHGFETGLPAVAAEGRRGGASHTLVSVLALLMLAAGALPAGVLYVARKASPEALLERYRALAALRRFFWNRWGIDAFYGRTFVAGTRRLAGLVAHNVEDPLDRLVHHRLPRLFTGKTGRLLQLLRTEAEELTYNMSYVLVLLALLLALLLVPGWAGR